LNTYLLTWNPKQYDWQRLPYLVHLSAQGWPVPHDWPCQHNKSIAEGDRFFLLLKRPKKASVMASGSVLSPKPYPARSDSSRGKIEPRGTPLFIDVNFDALLDPNSDALLPASRLRRGALGSVNWDRTRSGMRLSADSAQELHALWQKHLAHVHWPGLLSAVELPAGLSPTPKHIMARSSKKRVARK
jgi:hypothetical protein